LRRQGEEKDEKIDRLMILHNEIKKKRINTGT
jgi:hypothetical protein